MDEAIRPLVVLGQGYVGESVAQAFAQAGHRVVGLEVDYERAAALHAARMGDGKDAARRDLVARNLYAATTDPSVLATASHILICVPTPLLVGKPDYSFLTRALTTIRERAPSDAWIVLESTVTPGFLMEEVGVTLGPVLGPRVAYAPERIDPGPHRLTVQEIPRLVGGLSEEAAIAAAQLYRALGIDVQIVSPSVAAYAKLLENTYRLVNISLVDELAALCRADGVDIDAVVDAAATKPFGYQPFRAGAGAGGMCIPVSPAYLLDYARERSIELNIVSVALRSNVLRPHLIVAAVSAKAPRPSSRIGVIGVTYKPDVDQTHGSTALPILRGLEALGHDVWYHDPHVPLLGDRQSRPLDPTTLSQTDVVLVLVQHRLIVWEPVIGFSGPVVDATGFLNGKRAVLRV